MSVAGTAFRSAALLIGSPGCRRRPLISTKVRVTPRLRRFTVAVPVEPFETLPAWDAVTCGNALITSSVRVVPERRISWLLTTVTGLVEGRLGWGMREPVMTIAPWSAASPFASADVLGLDASPGPDCG